MIYHLAAGFETPLHSVEIWTRISHKKTRGYRRTLSHCMKVRAGIQRRPISLEVASKMKIRQGSLSPFIEGKP